MIKKSLLMMLFVACMASWATAATEIDGIYYNLYGAYSENPYAEVTNNSSSYNSYSGNITIPYSVESGGKTYIVTIIGKNAFRACTGLTSVVIPEGITSIGDCAFYGCNNSSFTSITLPSTVTTIGGTGTGSSDGRVFYNCTNLENINIPSGVTYIPVYAFYQCSKLSSIDIPSSVTSIGQYAFYGCTALSSVNIPSGVTTITQYAFRGCSALTSIILPTSITSIESNAFYFCSTLASVTLLGVTPPSLYSKNDFKRSYSNGDYPNFYVLKGYGDTYKETTIWSEFADHISEFSSISFVNLDLTNSVTALTIPSEVVVTVTGTLTNTDASHLIIEDGGQLITTSNSVKAKVKKTTNASSAKAVNNWYVISSPVNDVTIASIVGESTHNVYRYDEEEVEWEEYRDEHNPFSTLANGRGYLYRSTAAGIDFIGDVNVNNANYLLTRKATGATAGFQLIGNPYTHNIYKGANGAIENDYLEDGFYTLSAACAWVAGTDNTDAIAPTQAILVQAKSTADGETLEITNTAAGGPTKYGNNQIMFAVKNVEYSDVAYVLFKEGHGLNKVEHRNAEIPMLYVINNGEEFAIADMPDNTSVINLGFEAKTMGEYTISLKAEGQYSYMHLIDKLTGEDIDMLVEDSYTFIGSQNDRNDRFVLRLNYNAASIDTESDIFAYQSGNDIVVSGEGELQVFDITGRKVMTMNVNGVETINDMNNGVYIFRMEGKTQKIVVR